MPSLRRRRFLDLRCSGKSTYDAYREAGYKGTRHAAYQLLSDCKEELRMLLHDRRSDLERQAHDASLQERLELLKLLQKFNTTDAPR